MIQNQERQGRLLAALPARIWIKRRGMVVAAVAAAVGPHRVVLACSRREDEGRFG